ncbi:hypothetical protein [Streptosporangium roseum]|uniref:hypothetical protein n=1 Tax=Streptosporangium roseum TaxID=2001 RepID=UPI00333330DF
MIPGEQTSNTAEYRALIAALQIGHRHCPAGAVEIVLVSDVVIKQMLGTYGVSASNPELRLLRDQALNRAQMLPQVVLTKGTRDDTGRAYQEARQALSVDLTDSLLKDE